MNLKLAEMLIFEKLIKYSLHKLEASVLLRLFIIIVSMLRTFFMPDFYCSAVLLSLS